MEEATKKLLEETTKRIDIQGKSKQKEEELLNNSTQVIQEIPEKEEVKCKEDVKNKETDDETEDSDSSSDEDDNEELEASRAECKRLREEVTYEKGKNDVACKVIEKWEVERKELEKAIQIKDKEYSRAIEETDKNMRNIASLKEKLK